MLRRLVLTAVFSIAAFGLFGCAHRPPETGSAASVLDFAERKRPQEPWVFRSVLDGRARIVTVALSDALWVAYDASNCSLWKAWKGGVTFDGAVYTSAHGPQPTTRGALYVHNETNSAAWSVRRGGRVVDAKPAFQGYRFTTDGQVQLNCDLRLDDGSSVAVSETPAIVLANNANTFARVVTVGAVPKGVTVGLEVTASSATDLTVDGPAKLNIVDKKPVAYEWGDVNAYRAHFASGSGTSAIKIPLDTRIAAGVSAMPPATFRQGDESVPSSEQTADPSIPVTELPFASGSITLDGVADEIWSQVAPLSIERLVAGAIDSPADLSATFKALYDTRHLYLLVDVVDDVRQNDSALPFNDDAVEVYLDGGNEKADLYDDNDVQLIFGRGDAEFWSSNGVEKMPGTAFATAETDDGYRIEARVPWANIGVRPGSGTLFGMDIYVDDDDDGVDPDGTTSWYSGVPDNWSKASVFATVALGRATGNSPRVSGPRNPGSVVNVYWIDRGISVLRPLVAGQLPNASFVVPQVELTTPEAFGGLEERFIAEVSGYIAAHDAGTYGFNLISDDGARLWLDGEVLIDHDGLHGASGREAEVQLAAGEHPFRIEHFQNEGGLHLALEWRPPGQSAFALIPPSAYSHHGGVAEATDGGPKAIIMPQATGSPGDGRSLIDVHPSFDLSQARPDHFRPRIGGMDWLPDGRLVVCNWEPEGGVYVLDGVGDGDPEAITVKRIAAGLAEPLGLKVVDGRIYVLQKQELTELIDHDGDDLIDEYRTVANGWGVSGNFHEFAFGLVYKEGFFYATLATAINPGGASTQPQNPDRGRVIKIASDGSHEFVAHGLRTPNGIGIGVDGGIFVADNQGDWLPSSKIVHVQPGAFYGSHSVDPIGTKDLTETPPVVWLPQGEIGNSPSQPILLTDGPYAGQMAHGEVTHGGLKRVFVEQVEGAYQGAVFRFTQGLEAGVNRVTRGPDGAIYVGGIGSSGNWGQAGKKTYGLQRLAYNGSSTFEMLAVRALRNGIDIEFTEPIGPAAIQAADFEIRQWWYEPTVEYGGPKKDVAELPIASASLSDDRRRVFLELDGMSEGHVVYVHVVGPVRSASGKRLWSTESWYTLNRIPSDRFGVARNEAPTSTNQLTDAERAEGFTLLFDGIVLSQWRGFGSEHVPSKWSAVDGLLHFNPSAEGGGSLMTREQYADFDLRLEWRVAPGGNSGIMYRVTEDSDEPWHSGPEMQVLDNERHPDGANPSTSASANYALHAPNVDVSRPAMRWNEARLVVQGAHVEHWLNGVKVVEYELWSDDWNARVAASKFADHPRYGQNRMGHVVLQDHGDNVWYRNIRIKKL